MTRHCDEIADHRVEGRLNGRGQGLAASVIHHRVGHPAHHILAEADLGVHETVSLNQFSAGQVAQMARDGGRANVEGDAESCVPEARPDRGQVCFVMDGHRYRGFAFQ